MSRSNRLLVRPRLAQSHVMINKHKCRGFFLLSSHMVCVLITHPKHLISTGFRPVGLLSSPDLENVVQIRTGQSQSNPDRHLRCRKFLHFLSAVRVIRVLCLDLRSCFYLLRLRPDVQRYACPYPLSHGATRSPALQYSLISVVVIQQGSGLQTGGRFFAFPPLLLTLRMSSSDVAPPKYYLWARPT